VIQQLKVKRNTFSMTHQLPNLWFKDLIIFLIVFPHSSCVKYLWKWRVWTQRISSLTRSQFLFSHRSIALSTLFFLSSSCFHMMSFLPALLMRNNSMCSYWNEVQLLSAWANFVLIYKAFYEIFTTLKKTCNIQLL